MLIRCIFLCPRTQPSAGVSPTQLNTLSTTEYYKTRDAFSSHMGWIDVSSRYNTDHLERKSELEGYCIQSSSPNDYVMKQRMSLMRMTVCVMRLPTPYKLQQSLFCNISFPKPPVSRRVWFYCWAKRLLV